MTDYSLRITWLYPRLMNIYGDRGNVRTLEQRCIWRGIAAEVVRVSAGDHLTAGDTDLYFFGGGQDREQMTVAADLHGPTGDVIKQDMADDAVALTVCGGYQLFGHYYRPYETEDLPGIGVFDAWSDAGPDRFIGNVLSETDWGTLVGFENHSGRTFLGEGTRPFGRVVVGHGNNGQDGTEGAVTRNAFGCYLHGSLLPKNPVFADHLISLALRRKYGPDATLPPLDDHVERDAHAAAAIRAKQTR
ncbi:MAG: type 1 glutamine amidotransferase [Thermomicrobiales bacterium]